jgi:hypothetical protein
MCTLKRTLNPTLMLSTFESIKEKKTTKKGMPHTERITQELSKFAISAIQNEDSQNQEVYYFLIIYNIYSIYNFNSYHCIVLLLIST